MASSGETDFIINAGMVDSRQGSLRFVAILSKPLRAAEQEVRNIAGPLIALGVAIAILYFGRVFFITSLAAVMLAFILEPFVTLLVRFRFPRSLASFVVCAAALSVLYLMGLGAYSQLSGLAVELPKYSQRIGELVESVTQKVEGVEQRTYELVAPAHKPPPPPEPARKKRRTVETVVPLIPGAIPEVRIHEESSPIKDFISGAPGIVLSDHADGLVRALSGVLHVELARSHLQEFPAILSGRRLVLPWRGADCRASRIWCALFVVGTGAGGCCWRRPVRWRFGSFTCRMRCWWDR